MKKMKSVFASLAVGAVLVTGAVVAAPAANAALCGYPPVECNAGVTNPTIPQRIPDAPGLSLAAQATVANTPATSVGEGATSIGKAEVVKVDVPDRLKLGMLVDASATYNVKVKRGNGPYTFIGSVTSRKTGFVLLPTVTLQGEGVYTFALQGSDGGTFYVKVNAS